MYTNDSLYIIKELDLLHHKDKEVFKTQTFYNQYFVMLSITHRQIFNMELMYTPCDKTNNINVICIQTFVRSY